jgi:hypothetical protein
VATGTTLQEMQSRITFASMQAAAAQQRWILWTSDGQLWFFSFSKRTREFLG